MTNRSFKTYKALFQALQRDGIKPAGPTATLLLELFVFHNGRLVAGTVVRKRLCKELEFKQWRQPLIDRGWLVYDQMKYKNDWTLHQPGTKLLEYVNKERAQREEMASKAYVDAKFAAFAKAVMEKIDPPYTPQRLAMWIEGDIKTQQELELLELGLSSDDLPDFPG